MPELPDIVVYVESLRPRIEGQVLRSVQVSSPFVIRTFNPPIQSLAGKTAVGVSRMGKRIVVHWNDDAYLLIHLMIAGRLQWQDAGQRNKGRKGLVSLTFDSGKLTLTEAGSKRRAAIHVVRGAEALTAFHRGGAEIHGLSRQAFAEILRRENHTVKRSLTDPRLFSGIGNAYSDEILHRARLSPLKLTSRLSDAEMERLHQAAAEVLTEWTDRLRRQAGAQFPEKVTAFRPEMAVHGRHGQACPVCQTPVQRIVYADNECNYCPACQTEGRLLADRAMSRLLREDWPRSLDEWESHIEKRRSPAVS